MSYLINPFVFPSGEPLDLTDLVAYYNFENNWTNTETAQGSSDSLSASDSDLSANGTSFSSTTVKIGSYSMEDPSDSARSTVTGGAFTLTSDLTMELWINPDQNGDDGNYHAFCSKRSGSISEFNWYLSPSGAGGQMYLYMKKSSGGTTNVNSTTVVPKNTWSHVAVTINGTDITFYFNGSVDGTASVASNSRASMGSTPYGYGAISDTGTEGFSGFIDSASVWFRALSSAEISALYNGGAGAEPSNAVVL